MNLRKSEYEKIENAYIKLLRHNMLVQDKTLTAILDIIPNLNHYTEVKLILKKHNYFYLVKDIFEPY